MKRQTQNIFVIQINIPTYIALLQSGQHACAHTHKLRRTHTHTLSHTLTCTNSLRNKTVCCSVELWWAKLTWLLRVRWLQSQTNANTHHHRHSNVYATSFALSHSLTLSLFLAHTHTRTRVRVFSLTLSLSWFPGYYSLCRSRPQQVCCCCRCCCRWPPPSLYARR